jgi:hypothetical protein
MDAPVAVAVMAATVLEHVIVPVEAMLLIVGWPTLVTLTVAATAEGQLFAGLVAIKLYTPAAQAVAVRAVAPAQTFGPDQLTVALVGDATAFKVACVEVQVRLPVTLAVGVGGAVVF